LAPEPDASAAPVVAGASSPVLALRSAAAIFACAAAMRSLVTRSCRVS